MFFWIHAFQSLGFLGSRFFRVQGFQGLYYVRVQGPVPGFRSSLKKRHTLLYQRMPGIAKCNRYYKKIRNRSEPQRKKSRYFQPEQSYEATVKKCLP